MSEDLILRRLEPACRMLAEASSAPEAKRVVDLARAAEVYAQRQKLGEEAVKHATAIKIDAMTLLGEFLKAAKKRRKASLKERLTPCQVCRHPVSERHHLLRVADYGNNERTVPLCPNCHDLFHIAYGAGPGNSRRALRLFNEVCLRALNTPLMDAINAICALVREVNALEIEA